MCLRCLTFALVISAATCTARGQTFIAPQAAPSAAQPVEWGGYAVPSYGPPASGQAYTLAAPVALPTPPPGSSETPVWQPYPPAGVAVPSGAVPPVTSPGSPLLLPESPYPVLPGPEPSLRESLIPPDARDGFFQKARFTGTWLPQLDDDSLGWTDLRSEVMVALPFFTRENPILITPAYELHFLDRPAGLDLPPRLHDLTIDFHVFRVFGNHWIADFALTPGLFADDHSFDSSDAARINGRALAIYAPTLEWKWVLGVTYVNGAWNKIVPVAGVVFEPDDATKYELVFPRPRVAWRLPNSLPGHDEYWFYVLGEFANSIWAFEQNDGTPDTFAYRDWRLSLGLERKVIGGLSHRVEVGYVFNRDAKIASNGPGEIDLDDTLLLRYGLVY